MNLSLEKTARSNMFAALLDSKADQMEWIFSLRYLANSCPLFEHMRQAALSV